MNIVPETLLFLATGDLEQQITQLGMRSVLLASLALIVLTILGVLVKDRVPKLKLPIFLMMAITLVGTTALLFGSTIYLNVKSESGGPVHWHADIEFWACGSEFEFRDPTGFLSNKIGSTTYHEHNDKRIHLEGVVIKKSIDASLGKFMDVTGGYIRADAIAVPLNENQEKWFATDDKIDGDAQRPENFSLATGAGEWIGQTAEGLMAELQNGQYCSGGDEAPAELQVFVYQYDKASETYSQRKLDDPAAYVIRDESVVPPGDCVIVEFDTPRQTTDKLCEQYGVRDSVRCAEFGVENYNPELCNLREVGKSGSL